MMPEASDPALLLLMGEIKGQLRELIHNSNNLSAKFDGMALRVAALETERSRRDGAASVLGMALKSPAIGWLVGAAVSAWAVLTGKVHV